MRNLVVDDEPINRKVLSDQLQLAHYQVQLANDGFQAIEIIETGALPDLILLDVMMPRHWPSRGRTHRRNRWGRTTDG